MNADNVVVMNGRLVEDVDLRMNQKGDQYCFFRIAVNRAYKDQQGNRPADFHNCVANGKTAELIANYFNKGDMIGIFGELRDNNYEKDGVRHYGKQIVVDSIGFRDNRNNQGQNTQSNGQKHTNNGQQNTFTNDSPFEETDPVDISDDSLPF